MEELKKQLPTGHAVSDDSVDAECTLEEMERSQKDFLEGSLQMVGIHPETLIQTISVGDCESNRQSYLQSKRFSKMVEELCQHVMKRTSSFTVDEAHDCTLSLNQTLVLVENHLMKAQEAQIMVSWLPFTIVWLKKKIFFKQVARLT